MFESAQMRSDADQTNEYGLIVVRRWAAVSKPFCGHTISDFYNTPMQNTTSQYKLQPAAASSATISIETTPARQPDNAHVLFCGGFHSSMRGIKAEFLADLCQKNGWGFTRFDYRGHGESDGEPEYLTLHDWLTDTIAVLDHLPHKAVLCGSSMGAWLATHALLQRPAQIQALITIAAAPDFTQRLLWPALSSNEQDRLTKGECITKPTPYEGPDWRLRIGLFNSGKALCLLENDTSLDITVPVRMLHGTADADVPWEYSQRLLDTFTHSPDASLTLIQGADHRLSQPLHLNKLKEQFELLIDS